VNGKIYHNADGSIPKDNPFVGWLMQKKLFILRNPQGMTKHPVTGAIWEHEHGPQGGDEINIVKKGANYGWLLPMVLIMIILLVTSSKRRHSRS
jgi:glucose/arabinose dehydrogenase